jgi:hypothetical protein
MIPKARMPTACTGPTRTLSVSNETSNSQPPLLPSTWNRLAPQHHRRHHHRKHQDRHHYHCKDANLYRAPLKYQLPNTHPLQASQEQCPNQVWNHQHHYHHTPPKAEKKKCQRKKIGLHPPHLRRLRQPKKARAKLNNHRNQRTNQHASPNPPTTSRAYSEEKALPPDTMQKTNPQTCQLQKHADTIIRTGPSRNPRKPDPALQVHTVCIGRHHRTQLCLPRRNQGSTAGCNNRS